MLDRHPPVGKVAAHLTAPARPPEAEIVDHSWAVGGRVFLLRLDDLFHDDIEAGKAFDHRPIGIGDGLPKNRPFCLGRYWVSGCPGLMNTLSAVEMLLVPSDRKDFDIPACLATGRLRMVCLIYPRNQGRYTLVLEGILATLTGVDLRLAVIDPYAPESEEKPSRGGAAHYLVGSAKQAITSQLTGSDTESPYRYLSRVLENLACDDR